MINRETFRKYKKEIYKISNFTINSYEDYLKDFKKECYLCGNDTAIFEIRQINDCKYDLLHKPTLILCNHCISSAGPYDSTNFVQWFNIIQGD